MSSRTGLKGHLQAAPELRQPALRRCHQQWLQRLSCSLRLVQGQERGLLLEGEETVSQARVEA